MILYILLALVMLGVLITVHEFGHYLSARLCGIAVKEFSIGFGPLLWQHTGRKTGLLFSLRCIPLGGYCMFYGDTDDDPNGEKRDDPRNYTLQPVWKRIISVICGPLMNVIIAFVLAVVLCLCYGTVAECPVLNEVTPGSAAEEAGLLPGDRFVTVNGLDMDGLTATDAANAISLDGAGSTVTITVERGGELLDMTMHPRFDETEQRWLIGVTIGTATHAMPGGMVLSSAFDTCRVYATAIADALGKLVTTGEGLDQTSGPVGVVQLVAEQTQAYGFSAFLTLCVFISINLGMMNMLPIPGLDGCRLVFMIIEAVRGKPVNQKTESIIHLCGYAVLLLLMLYFTFKDVVRIFN